ncbi:MAG: hypothetical protein WA125_09825 [Desulfosporosinus sp.]
MLNKKCSYIILVIILISLTVYYIFEWSGYTPTGAIRKYVFFEINKFDAFSLSVGTNGSIEEGKIGKQYYVSGVTEQSSGGSINFFYLKQDKDGKWYVSSCGSGP